ncbi:hypothetical protein OAH94_05545 [Amylibacter sp.]|nr:hypothetical protein [Amylibacter sp.]
MKFFSNLNLRQFGVGYQTQGDYIRTQILKDVFGDGLSLRVLNCRVQIHFGPFCWSALDVRFRRMHLTNALH